MLEEHQKSHGSNDTGTSVPNPILTEMRGLLLKMKPSCASQALNALRKAYPSIPLEERVKAYESYASNIRRVFPHAE